jgi:D-alanyl-D-alanine carboxypeptidase
VDGVSDAGLRMQQIAAQLAALRSGMSPAATSSSASAASSAASAAAATGIGTSDSTGLGTTSSTSPSFGSVLADALAGRTGTSATSASSMASLTTTSTTATTSTPAPTTTAATGVAGTQSPGALSTTGVPTDLSHYENGRIPAALLKSLGTGNHRLWAPAADKFKAMSAAAARDGVHLGVNDSYRSYAEQVDMARRKGLYSQGGLAAKPGTSDHGWGKSVDLALDGRAQSWMRTHAAQYGFTANVPRESWHWTYKP